MTGEKNEVKSITEGGKLNISNVLPEVNGQRMKRTRRQTEFLITSSSDSQTRRMKKRKTEHKDTSVSPVLSKDVESLKSVSAVLSKGVQQERASFSGQSLKSKKSTYEERERNIMMKKWKGILQIPTDSDVHLETANKGYYQALKNQIKAVGDIHDANR